MKTHRLAELENAIERFYEADKKAEQNTHLLVTSSMRTNEAINIMRELEDAKTNLFKVYLGKK